MESGLLLIQFSPETSGAFFPKVIAAPVRGHHIYAATTSEIASQNANDRTIAFLSFVIYNTKTSVAQRLDDPSRL
jgi:hypothetical protein